MKIPADYSAPSSSFTDRVILVTGAGDGIGRAVAEALAKYGATVILMGRTSKKLERVYDSIARKEQPEAAIYPLDHMQASPDDYQTCAATIKATFGRLDGLVIAAAEAGVTIPFDRYNPEDWLKVLHTNLTAPFALTQAVLPLLVETSEAHGQANVVYCTDKDIAEGQAFRPAFSASKAGLQSMMTGLADELEHIQNLRINGIDPGAVNTATRRKVYPGANNEALPKPEAFAEQLLYCLGASCQVTGKIFQV